MKFYFLLLTLLSCGSAWTEESKIKRNSVAEMIMEIKKQSAQNQKDAEYREKQSQPYKIYLDTRVIPSQIEQQTPFVWKNRFIGLWLKMLYQEGNSKGL